jgi:hypothetical protein
MSQQRVHDPDASLPSAGSARALVPPFQRYYQGTATSCRPSRRASLPSFGGTTGTRPFAPVAVACIRHRAWGWSPGIPVRVGFRGDDRISQVPGEPPFPFAHVLRPRPADTSLTDCRTTAWPPLRERRRRRQHRLSRLNGMAFGLAAYVSRDGHPPNRARLASRCWSGFPGQAFTRRAPMKGFQLTSFSLSSSPKLLGTIPFSCSEPQRPRPTRRPARARVLASMWRPLLAKWIDPLEPHNRLPSGCPRSAGPDEDRGMQGGCIVALYSLAAAATGFRRGALRVTGPARGRSTAPSCAVREGPEAGARRAKQD